MSDTPPGWERTLLEKIALDGLAEQKAKRRWGIFFKLLGFTYVGVMLAMFLGLGDGEKTSDGKRHTALVQLNGVIQAKGEASADNVIDALQSAFADSNTAGVILKINSPGGSPVQSGIIHDEILRLRAKYPTIHLYVVVEDVCASGGYYVAAAADNIYVDKASIVGSIGVLMDGFGFTGTMEKLGVERRLLTAGENKGFLDPFSPQDAKQKAYAKQMLEEIHGQFIDVVRKGRGKRLKETPEMFSGLMWSGARGVELGLADGFGTVESVARDVIKVANVHDYTTKQNFAERIAKQIGTEMATSAAQALSSFSLH
ncbi:MAG TPA: S49 family peptidase [Rhodocyclaceae bacterium]|jgi:protease-4|nr:S49 family peptidase [Rhodocyclaceae bacterium]